MHQVQVDIQHGGRIGFLGDDMVFPNFSKKGAGLAHGRSLVRGAELALSSGSNLS